MPNRIALFIGLAGALALATATGAVAKSHKASSAALQASASTANDVPNARVPVPSFTMHNYRPGQCYYIVDRGRELGYWKDCPAGKMGPRP